MARKIAKPKKAKAVKSSPTTTSTFSQLVLMTGVFWLGNSVILLLFNELFSGMLVLGTHLISPLMAAVYAGGIISLLGVSATPVIEQLAMKNRWSLSALHWMALYLVVNTAIIWLVGRFAEVVGLGISAWWVALVLGLVFDIAQGLLVKTVIGSESN
jgi:hypothetical protein